MVDMLIDDMGAIDERFFPQVAFAKPIGSICNIDVQIERSSLCRLRI